MCGSVTSRYNTWSLACSLFRCLKNVFAPWDQVERSVTGGTLCCFTHFTTIRMSLSWAWASCHSLSAHFSDPAAGVSSIAAEVTGNRDKALALLLPNDASWAIQCCSTAPQLGCLYVGDRVIICVHCQFCACQIVFKFFCHSPFKGKKFQFERTVIGAFFAVGCRLQLP